MTVSQMHYEAQKALQTWEWLNTHITGRTPHWNKMVAEKMRDLEKSLLKIADAPIYEAPVSLHEAPQPSGEQTHQDIECDHLCDDEGDSF